MSTAAPGGGEDGGGREREIDRKGKRRLSSESIDSYDPSKSAKTKLNTPSGSGSASDTETEQPATESAPPPPLGVPPLPPRMGPPRPPPLPPFLPGTRPQPTPPRAEWPAAAGGAWPGNSTVAHVPGHGIVTIVTRHADSQDSSGPSTLFDTSSSSSGEAASVPHTTTSDDSSGSDQVVPNID